MVRRAFKQEMKLYSAIYDAIVRESPIDEHSLRERAERMKLILDAYTKLREQQRDCSVTKWSDGICYLLIVICTLQMLCSRFF